MFSSQNGSFGPAVPCVAGDEHEEPSAAAMEANESNSSDAAASSVERAFGCMFQAVSDSWTDKVYKEKGQRRLCRDWSEKVVCTA